MSTIDNNSKHFRIDKRTRRKRQPSDKSITITKNTTYTRKPSDAELRRMTINEQIDAFFKAGGEVEQVGNKLDETEPKVRINETF